MIKRVIEISERAAHLSVQSDQLRISPSDCSPADGEPFGIPCEDVGVLVVDNAHVTYSHFALARLAEFGAVTVLCGSKHLPAALVLPLGSNSEITSRLRTQISAPLPLKKRLWKQIVCAKIAAQAANLSESNPTRRRLEELAKSVRPGDPSNAEGQAAALYWPALAGPDFRRQREGDGVNALLNYGYSLIRAALARALVSSGLNPALGIHHSNRSNPFCLADDLLEPLRPIVDARVVALSGAGSTSLNPASKKVLLSVLHVCVAAGPWKGPLLVAMHRMTSSMVRCLAKKDQRLLIPRAVPDTE